MSSSGAGTPFADGRRFGPYTIIRPLGQGGMGAVFVARHDRLEREVALKVLAPEFSQDPDFRARFINEARLLAALSSPHVINVFEFGEENGQLFIATQLIDGPDLSAMLATRPVPLADGLDIVAQVADALSDAHARGVLHRDVKPSNILVREVRGKQHAYLCDFGIARDTRTDVEKTRGVIGTMAYLAPERHAALEATVASDIYSLGCVLFAVITGQAPYAGLTEVQTAIAHAQSPVPQVVAGDAIAIQLNHILQRSMAKNPVDRYPSAEVMRTDLTRAAELARAPLAGFAGTEPAPATVLRPDPIQPAPAPLPSTVPIEPGRSRRGPALAVAAAVVAMVLVAVAGVLLVRSNSEPDPDTAKTPVAAKKKPTASASPSPTPAPTTSAPAVDPNAPVVCWDGRQVAERIDCQAWGVLPEGRAGMTQVFPSLVTDCVSIPPTVPNTEEVYECFRGGYTLRFYRWKLGSNKYAYYDGIQGSDHSVDWNVKNEFAGRAWVSTDFSGGNQQPYRYAGVFRSFPYSVTIEAGTEQTRTDAVHTLDITPPSRIGIR